MQYKIHNKNVLKIINSTDGPKLLKEFYNKKGIKLCTMAHTRHIHRYGVETSSDKKNRVYDIIIQVTDHILICGKADTYHNDELYKYLINLQSKKLTNKEKLIFLLQR